MNCINANLNDSEKLMLTSILGSCCETMLIQFGMPAASEMGLYNFRNILEVLHSDFFL